MTHFLYLMAAAVGPAATVVVTSVTAALLGVPQGVQYDTTLAFEVGAVVLIVVMAVVVGTGLVLAVREEMNRS